MDNSVPLISIIIPCYNVASYVETAIQSIVKQTYTNLEIFIIDDASTDNTLEKINSFKDERIQVITFKANSQKVGAVNEVLKKVNGDYIAFQDSDDWSEPTRIQEQLNEFLTDTDLGICFTNYRYTGKKVFLPGNISITDAELRNEFLNYKLKRENGNSPTICGTMMISKSALKETSGYHPYFTGRVAEDIHWIYRILKDFKGITINKALYNYRLREGSFTQLQSIGIKPKYAYSWQLLSKIIYKDVHEGIDVLDPENTEILKTLELEACEEALMEKTLQVNATVALYENSTNFKIGKFILSPLRFLKSLNKSNPRD